MKSLRWLPFALLLAAGSAHGDPIQSEEAFTMPQGASMYRFIVKSTRMSGAGMEMDILEFPQMFVHGLTAKTNLLVMTPVVSKQMRMDGVTRRAFGLGDTALFIKQRLYRHDRLGRMDRISVFGGVKLPTGASRRSDSMGRLPPELQPGTGSFDFPFGVIFQRDDGRRSIFGDVGYVLNTEANGFRMGNVLFYNFSYSHRVMGGSSNQSWLFANLEVNGSLAARARSGGQRVTDSGGHVLFLSPGLQFQHKSGRWLVEASYQIPVVNDLNGNQAKPKRSWLLGVRVNF